MARHSPRGLAVLLVLVVALGPGRPAAAQGAQGATASSALNRQVDSLFATLIRPDGPGCAVGVYRDGEVVVTRAYGLASVEDGRPITTRTAFNLGSAAKPFTALAALMLESQGRLSLDDDVRRWVPELPDYGSPIRVRDLLQHTSGLRDYGSLAELSGHALSTTDDFLGLLALQGAIHLVPGTRHEYSHSDFELLAVVIQRALGEPFGDYLEREVLRPLGMSGSFVHDGRPRGATDRAFGHVLLPAGPRVAFPGSTVAGGSNLFVSVEDLAAWDRNFYEPNVGGAEVIGRMLARPLLPSGDTIPYAYGLRLGSYRGLRTVYRGGHDGGMRAEIIRFPDQRFTVATLCNSNQLDSRRLAEDVAEIYLEREMEPLPPRPTAPAAVDVPAGELARFAGVYRSRDDMAPLLPIELKDGVLGEVLFDDDNDVSFYPMTPAGDGRFFEIGSTGNVGIFTFHSPTSDGTVRLEISWNGGPPELLERLPDGALWRPSAAELAEYAGTWFSDDLDAAWRMESRGDQLILNRRGHAGMTLRPVARDLFERGIGPWMDTQLTVRLQFHRDSDARLTHLTVSTLPGMDPARDLRFVRIGRP